MMHTSTHNPAAETRLQRVVGLQMMARHDEVSFRTTLADLKADLEQVNRMIRVLEWAAARPRAGKA